VDGGLRQVKKARTRQRLVEVAVTLFEDRGFDEVTVEEIADAALVSPRTFYRYFGSKEGVLSDEQDRRLDLLRGAIAAHPAGEPPLAALRAGVLALARRTEVDDVELSRRRMRLVESTPSLGVHRRADLQPLWEQVIAEAIAARLGVDPDTDVRPRLLAGVGLAVLSSLGQTFQAATSPDDLESLVVARFALLADLVTAPGILPADVGRPPRTGTA
jgi:AcrR family transcriptional regulator